LIYSSDGDDIDVSEIPRVTNYIVGYSCKKEMRLRYKRRKEQKQLYWQHRMRMVILEM
jgi:hypothetical protein